jgi:hypothetical protein
MECKNCKYLLWDYSRKPKYGNTPIKKPFCGINGKQLFHIQWGGISRHCPLKYNEWT